MTENSSEQDKVASDRVQGEESERGPSGSEIVSAQVPSSDNTEGATSTSSRADPPAGNAGGEEVSGQKEDTSATNTTETSVTEPNDSTSELRSPVTVQDSGTQGGAAQEMNGNSDYHPHHPVGPRNSASSSSGNTASGSNTAPQRRQRNSLFGLNLDLNFDPSSWLVPSNVAGRSISSLSVLPDWVRHQASMIPNRGGDSTASPSSSQHDPHHHHNYEAHGGGGASRLSSHATPFHQGGAAGGSSWTSNFQQSNSIPSNMHHHHHHHHHHPHSAVPLRTRHSMVNTMRSVDEDIDSDYNNPMSAVDIGNTTRQERPSDSHSYVIDMDAPMGGWAEDDPPTADGGPLDPPPGVPPAPGPPTTGGPPPPDGSPAMADAATGANERTRAAEILRDAPETRAFINEISRYTTIRPFIVINFLKGVFDHGTSILAFLALVVTFSHANSMVKKEVSKQRKRNLLYLTMIVINLMACIAFIYYIFNEMELYYALVFLPTKSDLTAFWSLMWAVGVTDYISKFVTLFVKIVVLSLPGCVLPFQKRGKFYLFIEYSSQLYRSFLPVYPWLFYLVSAYDGTARMFGLLLAGIYIVFKVTDSVKRFKDWLKALEKLLSNVHYGTHPTTKQLDGAGTICPICHDTFANPTRLQCSHIFCEECVATWFDRERTCPMCRAKVVDDPTYRDGSTSQYIQLF